jgi:HPt (histidine-containing phosphotransfer) domain-containing protein
MVRECTPSGPVLDLEGALARLGGDKDLFADMAGFYLDDAPKLLAELQTALLEKNAAAVRMKAHALKGLVAGCGGERVREVAQAVEDAGNAGDLCGAETLLSTLQSELSSLTDALGEFARG